MSTKGYDGDHPAADFLRMRGFGAHHKTADCVLEGREGFDTVIHAMKVARPFGDFVNAAIAGRS
ncbi:DUF2461 family protein [Methylobacterium oryzae]|uniref:DUF2461 family protein n=1 Tax=Methylobacterium oryzae TaxID=334852 RepID=UPI002F35AE3C